MEDKSQYNLQHRKRLKERFMKAPNAVPNEEVVELLLGYVIRGRDVKPQAKDLIKSCKGIANLLKDDLERISGIGRETTIFFTIIKEFITRAEFEKLSFMDISCVTPENVFQFLKYKIGSASKENFLIIYLDTKNKIKDYKIIREGFIDSINISARDIIETAVLKNAASVIIAHNHPSGDPEPSTSDFNVTRQICHALLYTGITLLDHLIVTMSSYYSMSDNGFIKQFYKENKEANNL